ncbi:MAG TPA: AEC family transporter [Pseudogulbenkiania sp.]|nr:AEC family transporter [Pseudogulbenkiania sp.]
MLDILVITSPIFIIISVGFLAVQRGFFSKSDNRTLGMFVINIALPALMFKALSQRPLAEIINPGYLLSYAAGSLVLLALGVAFAYGVRKKDLRFSALYGIGMAMPNSGFIGFPIVSQLLGPGAAVTLAMCMLVENALTLPIAMMLAESAGNSGEMWHVILWRTLSRLLCSPLILSIFAGFSCSLLELPLPGPLTRAIDMFAMASGAVALFVIGGNLVGLKVKGIAGEVTPILLGKLVLHPLAVLGAILLLPPFDPRLQAAAIAFAGMPMLSIYPIFGQKYGQEGLCAAALLAATITSFVSISILLWLIRGSGLLGVAG